MYILYVDMFNIFGCLTAAADLQPNALFTKMGDVLLFFNENLRGQSLGHLTSLHMFMATKLNSLAWIKMRG